MARYVMLEFEDNEMAEDFVKAVHKQKGVIFSKPKLVEKTEGAKITEQTFHPLEKVIVRGLWFKPVNFCECKPEPEEGARNFVKGAKFGIYVHKVCKRPRRGRSQWPKNLLDPTVIPGAPQRVWLQAKEPIDTAEPTIAAGKVVLPNLGFTLMEPTPKAEADRVKKNLDKFSQS